nr:hypothetical protein [Fibrisoma limi]
MQALRLKKSLFIALLTLSSLVQAAPDRTLRQADSLFAAGAQADAALLYESVIAEGHSATDAMLLKLASAYEQQNDIPRLLYYLQVYFDRHPDEAVLRKMNDIARASNLSGYETDDLNYFYLFYKQYGIYLLLFLLIPAGYVFTVLVVKLLRKETVPKRQKWVMLVYLIMLLIFVNLPEGFQSGITSHERVLLRTGPSSAAPVAEIIGRGNKVNILGSQDIWLRVLWHNQLFYIRRDNVWVI